jgi:hypothetical protein
VPQHTQKTFQLSQIISLLSVLLSTNLHCWYIFLVLKEETAHIVHTLLLSSYHLVLFKLLRILLLKEWCIDNRDSILAK